MRGHTLVELLLVLTLMGATGASLAPTALRYRDRASVVAAREALVGLLAEARLAAVESGGARVHIVADPWVASVESAGSTLRTVHFAGEYGVDLGLSGGGSSMELRFNALGLGIMAAQTVAFRRGSTEAEVVVSAYGRVRRR